jgi:hypothetical protein
MGELRGPDDLARSPMGFVAQVEMNLVSVECEAGGVQQIAELPTTTIQK